MYNTLCYFQHFLRFFIIIHVQMLLKEQFQYEVNVFVFFRIPI